MKNIIKYAIILTLFILSCAKQYDYDVIIRGGTVYDGSGSAPAITDIGIKGDIIKEIGPLGGKTAETEVNAEGLAVAPGFINMLSWATTSLIKDGRSMAEIKQGVTLEIMGEGNSMGPLTDKMKENMLKRQGDIKYDIEWTTLGEYLEYLEKRGVSTNIGSFVGATTARINVLGYEDRAPNSEELKKMIDIVRQAMEEGAFGVSSALIYTPGFYAKTGELAELAIASAEYDGMYISHMRSEGDKLLEAFDEFLDIARL
ncbi:D-aminoacylase, partial [candidate division KSB1 bacterium]